MFTTKLTRIVFLGILLLSIATFLVGCADSVENKQGKQEQDGEESVTRIAILVDQSGSFVKNLPAAAQIIQRFIRRAPMGVWVWSMACSRLVPCS